MRVYTHPIHTSALEFKAQKGDSTIPPSIAICSPVPLWEHTFQTHTYAQAYALTMPLLSAIFHSDCHQWSASSSNCDHLHCHKNSASSILITVTIHQSLTNYLLLTQLCKITLKMLFHFQKCHYHAYPIKKIFSVLLISDQLSTCLKNFS